MTACRLQPPRGVAVDFFKVLCSVSVVELRDERCVWWERAGRAAASQPRAAEALKQLCPAVISGCWVNIAPLLPADTLAVSSWLCGFLPWKLFFLFSSAALQLI